MFINPSHMTTTDFIWGVVVMGSIVQPVIKLFLNRLWHFIFLRSEKELEIWLHYVRKTAAHKVARAEEDLFDA